MAEVTEDRPRVQMRRECLASSAINSNRLEDCESTDSLSGYIEKRRTNALPRNRGFDAIRFGIRATGRPSTIDDDCTDIYRYIFFPDRIHTRAFCAILAILMFQY